MLTQLVVAIAVASGVLAILGLALTALDREVSWFAVGLAGAIELLVLVQAGLAIAGLVRGDSVDGVALFIAYLVFAIVVLPIGFLFAVSERNRWSGTVVAVAAVALVVTILRMDAVWLG